jgi:predicted ATPase
MRLLRLEIEGFRSLRSIQWKPARLNIVIGKNGSGKSNLLFALDVLAAASRGEMDRYVARQGGLSPLLWDGVSERMHFRIRTSPIDPNRDVERDSLTYHFELSRLGSGSAYRVENELLGNFYRVETGQRDEPLKLLERNTRHAVVFDEQQRALVPLEDICDGETILSATRGPFCSNRLIAAYQKTVASWSVLREFQSHRGAEVRQAARARRETQVHSNGSNLISVLHTHYSENREFKQAINQAMTEAFGPAFDELLFPPMGDQRIELRVRWKNLRREQPTSEISAGTLRFLYLLTVLASPEKAPLIAIDEPELGLHPAMLPIVADFASKASKVSQVILTTSTPALLDAFPESPPTTIVTWQNGETALESISGDALEDWLVDYSLESGQGAEEIAETATSPEMVGQESSEETES